MDSAELSLLSALLGAPDEDSLPLLREAAAALPWLRDPVAELEQWPLDHWQGEHTRLFIAGFPRTPCPPFASVWVEKRMHGVAMESLVRFYRRLGLEPTDMPADFLGTLLECAAVLADEPAREEAAVELWRDHLLPWLPEFAAALSEAAHLKIYHALAARLNEITDAQRLATPASGAA